MLVGHAPSGWSLVVLQTGERLLVKEEIAVALMVTSIHVGSLYMNNLRYETLTL